MFRYVESPYVYDEDLGKHNDLAKCFDDPIDNVYYTVLNMECSNDLCNSNSDTNDDE